MIKIFLTGDNHIGTKYSKCKRKDELVSMRMAAFEQMVEKANEEHCDLFAITGDLFDSSKSVAKKTVASLMQTLSRFEGEVLILPGNHDYYTEDSQLWAAVADAIQDIDNILPLTEYRPYPLTVRDEQVVIYPAFCQSKHSEPDENNLGWIKALDLTADTTIRIGMAHGCVAGESLDSEEKYFVMTREELDAIPVDAWLVGHTHVPFPRDLSTEASHVDTRIFNAGTHMQVHVSNNTEGNCFILEISEGSGKKDIAAKRYTSGPIQFLRKYIEIAPGATLAETLAAELRSIDPNTVINLVLSGALDSEEFLNRGSMIEAALDGFFEGTYDDTNLNRRITHDAIRAEFAETSLEAQLLLALTDPKEVQMLYELLTDNRQGGGKKK